MREDRLDRPDCLEQIGEMRDTQGGGIGERLQIDLGLESRGECPLASDHQFARFHWSVTVSSSRL